MDPIEVMALVDRSVHRLFAEDDTLPPGVNERTLTHRIAIYLEDEVRRVLHPLGGDYARLSVDCEYNRRGESAPKEIVIFPDAISPAELEATTVYPDIIVHIRGSDDLNFLAIEVKREPRNEREEKAAARDRAKVAAYKAQVDYDHAVFVRLDWSMREHHAEPV